MSRIAAIRRAAVWAGAGQYIVFAMQFVVSVLISRFFLSPAEMGVFSVALSAAMLAAFFQDFGMARYISGHPALDDGVIRTCFSVSLVFALAVGLIILAAAWPMGWFFGDMQLAHIMAVIAASYLIVPFGIVPNAVLQRNIDLKSMFLVSVGAALTNSVVALGLAALGWSAMSLAWAAVAQQTARVLIGQWRSGVRLPWPLRFTGAREVVKFGSATSLLYVSGAIGTRSPELVIGRMLGFNAVGLFGRASSVTAQLQALVIGAVDSMFYPVFARLRDDGERLDAPYLRVAAAYTAVTWPAMAFLAATATPIVMMLYGPRWSEVAPLLMWIAIAQCFFAAIPMHYELPILLGRMKRLLVLNGLDTAVSVALLIVAGFYGVMWAAISRVVYGMVWYALYIGIVRELTGFAPRALLLAYGKSLAATAATAAPVFVAYEWIVSPAKMDVFQFAACGVAGGLCWLIAVYAVRHPIRLEVSAIIGSIWGKVARRGAELPEPG